MANEKRVRNNNVQGTLSSTMNSTGTTMNSAGLANLEAISSTEHAAIIIDPGRTAGAPEIVHVTAHTGSATSATVVRGREGTAARAHSSTEEWIHAPTATIDFLPFRPPSVRVEGAAATTVASGSTVAVIFGTEVWDTDGMWSSTANTRLEINTAGKYLVGGHVRITESTGGTYRAVTIRKNGAVDLFQEQFTPPETGHLQTRPGIGPVLISLTSTEYLQLMVNHAAGVSLTVAATTTIKSPAFWAIWQSS